MGRYLNPIIKTFQESIQSEIYVDKTDLIKYTNRLVDTEQKFVCVSRPRRFGKSMAVKMLSAYYNCEEDSTHMFQLFKISEDETFITNMNKYNVLSVNMQDFLSNSSNVDQMLGRFTESIKKELLRKYPEVSENSQDTLVDIMYEVFEASSKSFVILIDEWDSIFREYKEKTEEQKKYLDFLRDWLKDKPYVGLAYMTGILPIKKYGTHSALNMFTEYSMSNPKQLAEFVGFTEDEVKALCTQYKMSFEETKSWYDGYSFQTEYAENVCSIYSPKSVVECMLSRVFDNYWNQTETFEALKIYIQMNYDGLKDKVIEMMAGARVKINTGSFTNDMSTFHSADDVLTLLIHLGYLGYDFNTKEAYIPNKEVSNEFVTAVSVLGWGEVISAIKSSENLLTALWNQEEEVVAQGIQEVHESSSSILQYNDENALS